MTFQPNLINTKLSELSYYKTGGDCLGVIAPRTTAEAKESLSWILQQKKPYFVLGGGTNSLVTDEPYPGYVLSLHLMTWVKVERERGKITLGAGVSNTEISKLAHENQLGDISWMYRLPGQIGGTVRMNARCYGGEISQVVSRVVSVAGNPSVAAVNVQQGGDYSGSYSDRAGESWAQVKTYEAEPGSLEAKKIFRGYKDTFFMDSSEVICEVTLSLTPISSNAALLKNREKMTFCETDRESKGQFEYPSCGCVFKNDHSPEVSVSSGFLLEACGLKGKSVGLAEVTSGHANFVYNKGAKSQEILELSFAMRQAVYDRFGVWLEYEMELLGHLTTAQREKFLQTLPFDCAPEKKQRLDEIRRAFQKKIAP